MLNVERNNSEALRICCQLVHRANQHTIMLQHLGPVMRAPASLTQLADKTFIPVQVACISANRKFVVREYGGGYP